VLTYAVIRPGYVSFIYGGGLTRSLAWLFALIAILLILKCFSTEKIRDAIPIPILFALTAYCHLESAWFLVFSFILLVLFLKRTRKGLYLFLYTGFVSLILTSFYLIRTISVYGFSTLASAFTAGQFNFIYSVLKFFQFNFTTELFFPMFSAFAFIGVFALLASKNISCRYGCFPFSS